MIEKMKQVCVVSSVSGKEKMLEGLRELGLLHLAEKKAPKRVTVERFQNLSKTAQALLDYAPNKKEMKKKGKKQEPMPVLDNESFEKMYEEASSALERKASLAQEINAANAEIERVRVWGDFEPGEVKALKAEGIDFHFYRLGKNEADRVMADPELRVIKLADIDKMTAVASIGKLPPEIPAAEFSIPEKSITQLQKDIDNYRADIAECEQILRKAALYDASFQAQMLRAQNAENYSAAGETAESDENFVWIRGYMPEADLETFRTAAAANGWAWAAEDVDEDDQQVPTKVRYNKVSGLIKPVFDILGILPGYRESDISLWFFLFFTLFFAMIIGDGGYGVLILLGTIGLAAKMKKFNNIIFLLLVLSIATIIWGAITGTWFGLESAMNVPFLKAMVIPSFANYPEYFGVTALAQQSTIMKFSFSIGAIQMAIGSLIAVKKKIPEKNLSWVADIGWLIAIVAMYLLSLNLVIGESISLVPVFILIGAAFLLVVLFGGMSPEKTFGQGLKSGVADAFTVFLNTISCFGNVMSYIRLFAVGMAGLAISQSFNGIAAGFSGPLIVLGVIVVIIGHTLNIVMCFLSVVVHGVRLNVLEFSGQAGLEWTGIEYEPFKENKKIVK
ncbi:MAG: hypothetical protein HUJ76_02130 [Parasporobacterium sp.]|nr:hypothetical protein [Parasporobacterium sp.]